MNELPRLRAATGEVRLLGSINDATPRRLAWGARAIARYLGQSEKWLRRQLERAKAPPPTFRIGSAVVADCDELDRWIADWKAKTRR